MDKKTTDIVAYLTLVGWLIAFLAGDKENSKFHLNQSLVLVIANIASGVVGVILGFIPLVGGIISFLISICLFVLWILGFVSALQGTEKSIPVLGSIQILK